MCPEESGTTSSSTMVLISQFFFLPHTFFFHRYLLPSYLVYRPFTTNWFVSIARILQTAVHLDFKILSYHAGPSLLNYNLPIYLHDEYWRLFCLTNQIWSCVKINFSNPQKVKPLLWSWINEYVSSLNKENTLVNRRFGNITFSGC